MEIHVVHRSPHPTPLLKGLGILAGVAAVGITAALCLEQYEKRELGRSLVSKPGISNVLPALHANARLVLMAMGHPVPPTRDKQRS